MHKYTIELTAENDQVVHERNRYTLRQFFNVESSASVCYLIIAAAAAVVVVVVVVVIVVVVLLTRSRCM